MLDECNPYTKILRSARDIFGDTLESSDVKIILISGREKEDNTYNLPASSEVAALYVGDFEDENAFASRLHKGNNKRKRVVATPTRFYSHSFSSVRIISRETFLAAIDKETASFKTSVIPPLPVTSSPDCHNHGGTSLQIISRQAYEATRKKEHRVTKTSYGSSSFIRSVCLGEGAHGVVHLAFRNDAVQDNALPEKVAIKSAPITASYCLNDEEQILKCLSSPYVVSCYGSNITWSETRPRGSDFNLILEYCSGGSIADYMRYRGAKITKSDVQLFALHILRGINYIHSKKIIHCDIKPANILLKPGVDPLMPYGLEAKICDFGLALRKTSDEYGDGSGLTRGSLLYMSPELLYYGNLDYCADIWSFGCTILEMFTGNRPWSELGKMDRNKLKDVIGKSQVTPEIPIWLSDDARDFIGKCLQKDPQKRFDSNALLKHKFMSAIDGHDVKYEKEMKDEDIK